MRTVKCIPKRLSYMWNVWWVSTESCIFRAHRFKMRLTANAYRFTKRVPGYFESKRITNRFSEKEFRKCTQRTTFARVTVTYQDNHVRACQIFPNDALLHVNPMLVQDSMQSIAAQLVLARASLFLLVFVFMAFVLRCGRCVYECVNHTNVRLLNCWASLCSDCQFAERESGSGRMVVEVAAVKRDYVEEQMATLLCTMLSSILQML